MVIYLLSIMPSTWQGNYFSIYTHCKTGMLPFLNTSFFNHFENLIDPRIERSKEHLLIDIVAIAILAVIGGAEGSVRNRSLWNS
jgi:hypothetical protein